MKRCLIPLIALLATLGLTVGPAAATDSFATATLATTGNCTIDLRISNSNGGGHPASGSGYISPITGGDAGCTWMELRTQIYTCSGTISLSGVQAKANPRTDDFLQNFYAFGCTNAHVTGIFVRVAASNGDWSPNQVGGDPPEYVFYSFVDDCQPAICQGA